MNEITFPMELSHQSKCMILFSNILEFVFVSEHGCMISGWCHIIYMHAAQQHYLKLPACIYLYRLVYRAFKAG